MHRAITTLALALCVLGCGVTLGPVTLLTGGDEGCSIGGVLPMGIAGVLIADSPAGTAIKVDPSQTQWGELAGTTIPVRWPTGYTGRRLVSGEVEVLRAETVVVTTGRRVALSTQWNASSAADAYPTCGGSEVP